MSAGSGRACAIDVLGCRRTSSMAAMTFGGNAEGSSETFGW
jgi:hypothetical protein